MPKISTTVNIDDAITLANQWQSVNLRAVQPRHDWQVVEFEDTERKTVGWMTYDPHESEWRRVGYAERVFLIQYCGRDKDAED